MSPSPCSTKLSPVLGAGRRTYAGARPEVDRVCAAELGPVHRDRRGLHRPGSPWQNRHCESFNRRTRQSARASPADTDATECSIPSGLDRPDHPQLACDRSLSVRSRAIPTRNRGGSHCQFGGALPRTGCGRGARFLMKSRKYGRQANGSRTQHPMPSHRWRTVSFSPEIRRSHESHPAAPHHPGRRRAGLPS
jgi:hypothetical protein